MDGKDELAKYPYFAVETRLRACNSMVFRLPILDTVENANVGGIAGLAIRPIVTEMVEVKPTVVPTVVPTTQSPTEQPTTQPTNPPTQSPTEQPTTVLPTTQPTEIPTIPSTPTITLTSCSQLDSLPSQLPSVTQLILSSEFDCDGTVDLKRFVNCESIEVESNAMKRCHLQRQQTVHAHQQLGRNNFRTTPWSSQPYRVHTRSLATNRTDKREGIVNRNRSS